MMRRLWTLLPLALFLVLAGYFGIALTKDPNKLPSALLDRPAPDFTLPLLKEPAHSVTRNDLVGQVTLVNFFASWCAPCRVEHAQLMAIKRQGVHLIGIAYKDKNEDSLAWLAENGDPYSVVAADASGRTAIDFGVYGVPETYLVDKTGAVRYRQVGVLSEEDWEGKVKPLLAALSK